MGIKEVDIVLQLNDGDKKAFKCVFDSYYKTICLFVQKYISDSDYAEDIAQDVFITIWEKKLQFENLNALRSYLYRTARNKAINVLEHENVKKGYQSNAQTEYETDDFFNQNFVQQETQRLLLKMLDSLSPRAREILYLQLEGFKNQEIADQLNISVYTVKNHKAVAYRFLKEKLKNLIFLILLIGDFISM